ncbi:MAG: glucose-6-phosphate isomerase [Anaeroplasmataceae bacterium]
MKIDITQTNEFYSKNEYNEYIKKAKDALSLLLSKKGVGNDYVGWLDLVNFSKENKELYDDIIDTTNIIKKQANILVVVGIGGSYLGSKAFIEMFKDYFSESKFKVIFLGQNLSSKYYHDIKEYLKDKDFCVNVISKSGTTTEPAIAFRFLKDLLIEKYGKEYNKRVYATTDKEVGALNKMSKIEEYKTFYIPSNVGGRYSVFTPAGLLPMAFFGIDIIKLLKGVSNSYKSLHSINDSNPVIIYSALRNLLYSKGYIIELQCNYEERLRYYSEWWKQLYGESEGKNAKGIFPASASFTTDLHSLGQIIQDGHRNMFETIINVTDEESRIDMLNDKSNIDELNYLEGKTLHYINDIARQATTNAHVSGKVPNITVHIDKIDEESIGELTYFFMLACGVSGYILGVNPFDQPGVESYKKNMFEMLGKNK